MYVCILNACSLSALVDVDEELLVCVAGDLAHSSLCLLSPKLLNTTAHF